MLLFKRLATTLVLSVILFFVVFVGTMMVGGGIMGARMASQNQGAAGGFNQGYEIGYRAGIEFRQQYGSTVRWAALGMAAASAVGLSFSGTIPWCRRPPRPPPLPPAGP